jgi:hypothetical protein
MKNKINKTLSDKLNTLAQQDYMLLSKRNNLNKIEKERLERIKKYIKIEIKINN